MPKKHHHNVYVVELSPEVLQHARFRKANPDYDATKPCVYVGMTRTYLIIVHVCDGTSFVPG
jgi:hypothetical protein